MNPILPRSEYIPDTEARVWADGRLYLYGSRDREGVEDYCSNSYKVFSTDDLVHWTDHGVSFETGRVGFCEAKTLYAPDCVFAHGRYWLFFCMPGGREGVAVSDTPAGPFVNASPVEGADGLGIDPTALVDDDGSVYLYWGQDSLHAARLSDDMRSILPATLHHGVLTHEAHGFHEGASIRKIKGRFVLLYCDGTRGRATSLSYAVADSPFGPFDRRDVVIDNTNCDPLSWNIHGSLCNFRNQWYVFYHRSSGNSRYQRRVCAEPVTIHPDGTIDEVCMTTRGAGPTLRAADGIDAWRACSLYGRIHTRVEGNREFLHSEGEGNTAELRDVLFAGESSLRVCVRGSGGFLINPGWLTAPSLARIEVEEASDWIVVVTPLLQIPEGELSLHLYFTGGTLDVGEMTFFSEAQQNDT